MPKHLKILVVDDNRSAADALARVLGKSGDEVKALYDGWSAIQYIETDPPDVVLTDLKMEPVDGMAVLRAARSQRPPIECLVFTAFGDVSIAVEAMRLGARDFLTKPVTVEQVTERLRDIRGVEEAPAELPPSPKPFVANSSSSKQFLGSLQQIAGTASRVWIQGEIGSGRVYAAETLYAMDPGDGPLRVLDVGRNLPWPRTGTVVIPNVDDLPEDLQQRLHRNLSHAAPDLRIITTASTGLTLGNAEGHFRSDLFYELAVVVVDIPPLRDRQEDILPLFDEALGMFAEKYGRTKPTPGPESISEIQRHAWPGNVRELRNLAERMVVMGMDRADFQRVDAVSIGGPSLEPGFNLANYMESVERSVLSRALAMCDGDRSAAGKLLGVERNTLRYKLNKYDLLES